MFATRLASRVAAINPAAQRHLRNRIQNGSFRRFITTTSARALNSGVKAEAPNVAWWTTGRALSLSALTGVSVFGISWWFNEQKVKLNGNNENYPPSYGTLKDMHTVSYEHNLRGLLY